jgi:hypothetical protein
MGAVYLDLFTEVYELRDILVEVDRCFDVVDFSLHRHKFDVDSAPRRILSRCDVALERLCDGRNRRTGT